MKSVDRYADEEMEVFHIWFGSLFEKMVQGPHLGDPPASCPQNLRNNWVPQFSNKVSLSYALLTGSWKNIVMQRCIRMPSSTDFISADFDGMIAMSDLMGQECSIKVELILLLTNDQETKNLIKFNQDFLFKRIFVYIILY
jgi:hypothetical protein